MSKIIVSLGSGCAVAQIVRDIGLRSQSFPFDWVWNFDGGLEIVTQIIDDDFKEFKDQQNLIYADHYRWPFKVVVNKKYPKIAHIHSNPLNSEEDYQTLIRRVTRFQELLKSNQVVEFVYFRDYQEFVFKKENSLKKCIDQIYKETLEFNAIINHNYNNLNFVLTLVLVVPRQLIVTQKKELINYADKMKNPLKLQIVYCENESKSLKDFWFNLKAYYSWLLVFYHNKNIGFFKLLTVFVMQLNKRVLMILKAKINR